jgi:hypothetical protein
MVQRYIVLFILPFLVSFAFATERIAMPANRNVVFVENRGQIVDIEGHARPDILFTAEASGAKIFFTRRGISYVLTRLETDEHSRSTGQHTLEWWADTARPQSRLTTYRLDVEFEGASLAELEAREPARESFNYYYAHCPDGITDVRGYKRIVYRDVYPFIDLALYIRNNKLKYDFIVHPGGNPGNIRLRYRGADSLVQTRDGSLRVVTPLGSIEEERPYTYQGRKEVRSWYRVEHNLVRFEIGRYNTKEQLVIDPGVVWSTYYGGGSNDSFYDVVTDASRNVIVSGFTASVNYPVQNAIQTTNGGFKDACVVKMNPDGGLLWATYYGGSNEEYATTVDVMSSAPGEIAVAGMTLSPNFPVANALQSTYSGSADAFMLKLSSNGQRIWATFFGGTGGETAHGVGINNSGIVTFMGHTSSNDMPVLNAFQSVSGGGFDMFLARTDQNGQLFWSTYMGGNNTELSASLDAGDALAIDISGNIIIGGGTMSTNFPVQTAFQPTMVGISDGFFAKFNPFGELLWSTYYGGSGGESIYGVTTDGMENVIVCGATNSSDFPLQNPFQSTYQGNNDGFIVKFNPWGQRTWATYYGGSNQDFIWAVDVDPNNNIYMVGSTLSGNLSMLNPWQANLAGSREAFAGRLTEAGQRTWGTFFGGGLDDSGFGIDVDNVGNILIAGVTRSVNLPVIQPYQNMIAGSDDGFVVKFGCEMVEPQTTPTGFVEICQGTTVTISVPPRYGSYLWSNGATTPSITVSQPGVYNVMVANGPDCTSASRPVTVNVLPRPLPVIDGPAMVCTGSTIALKTTKPFVSYRWTSAAGTQILSSTALVAVSTAGSYIVTVTDEKGCTGTSAVFQVIGAPVPETRIVVLTGATTICPGDSVTLTATGVFSRYIWSHGPTTASVVIRQAGTYTVTVVDDNGCTSKPVAQTIDVVPIPTDPIRGLSTACLNSETSFSVQSRSDINYQWAVTGGTIITDATAASIRVRWTTSGIGSISVTRVFRGCSVLTGPMQVAVADSLQPAILGSTVLCPGGEVVLKVDGVYTNYEWSNGATSTSITVRAPGVYQVRVTDSDGCAGTSQRFTVTSGTVPQPLIRIDGLPELCNGDSTVLRVDQSFATYLWADGSTGASLTVFVPGIYSVRVSNEEGCSSTASVTIPAAPPLVPVIDGPVSICRNATAGYGVENIGASSFRWSISGGTIISDATAPTVSVQWGSGTTGTLTVEVTRNGTSCTGTTTLTILIEETLRPVVTAASLVLCPDGEILLRAPAGYSSYEWIPGGATGAVFRVTRAGVYRVHVQDAGGCEGDSEPVEIREGQTPVVAITTPAAKLCPGAQTTLEATTGFRSYLWSTGETTADITVATAGDYTVTVTDENGCKASTSFTVGIVETGFVQQVHSVWPNVAVGAVATMTYSWINISAETVHADASVFTPPIPEFVVVASPALPADIAPGNRLTLTVSFQPQQEGHYLDTLLVISNSPCPETFRLTFDATATLKEIPVSLAARLPDTTAYPWMRAYSIPLYMQFTSSEIPGAQSVEFEVAMDTSVFFPRSLTRGIITGTTIDATTGERVLSGRIDNVVPDRDEIVLTEIVGDVLLGERDNTVLSLRRLTLADGTRSTTQNGLLTLEGICREGGARFVRSTGGFGITIQPQPVHDVLTALVEVVEAGECSLELYGVDGRSEVVRQWYHRAGSDGATIIMHDVSSKGSGVYWLVLHTPTQTVTSRFIVVK